MRDKMLLAAAAGLLAFPAIAQVGSTASPPVNTPSAGAATGMTAGAATGVAGKAAAATPPPVNPAPTTPPGSTAQSTTGATSSAGATATTGTAANTSAAEADLRTGAVVRDSAGVEVGRISKITKGKSAAETQVTLSSGGRTVSLPASSLSMSEGALVTSQTKADIWAPK